jgi:VanZ family protein
MTALHELRQRPWLYLWLPLVAWMGLIFYLSAQPDLPHPEVGLLDTLFGSGAHAFVFGVLAVLWARVLGKRDHALLIAFALTMLYALSDELHQAFVPGRTTDPWDLICDAIGAAVGLAAWAWLQKRRKRSRRGRPEGQV